MSEPVASERLTDVLREIAEARPAYILNCPHGRAPYMLCGDCERQRWMAARELVLYDTLDRFSAAIERLADVLGAKPNV